MIKIKILVTSFRLGYYNIFHLLSDIIKDIIFHRRICHMDIASLSMNLAQSNLMSNVGTAILAKSIDQAQVNGNTLDELIDSAALERSVNPDIGANIDIRI
jgi:hypothetical protein